MQINTDYRNKFSNSSANGVQRLTSKKTVNKISEKIVINHLDDDSASLSIRDEHPAKRKFFQILMGLDDGLNIVATVLFNLNSVREIISALKKPNTDSMSLIREIENIRTHSEFDAQKLLDGSFFKALDLWLPDNPSLFIDFRNPGNGGLLSSSIDFNIENIQVEGNLVTGLSQSLGDLALSKSLRDFNQLDLNIKRMEEHVLGLKTTILDYYKQLEIMIQDLSGKADLRAEELNLFIHDIRKELSEKSARSMRTQINENHANALGLLP